jgi:hypothetical protein
MGFRRINIGDADFAAAIPNRIAIHDAVRAPTAFAYAKCGSFGIGDACGKGSDAANRGWAR